jgi:hypothetical protein
MNLAAEKGAGSDAVSTLSNYLAIRVPVSVERISAEFDVIQISGCATIATSWRASDAVVRRDRGLAEERRGLSESEVRAAGSSVGPRRCDRPGEKETASPSSIHGQMWLPMSALSCRTLGLHG